MDQSTLETYAAILGLQVEYQGSRVVIWREVRGKRRGHSIGLWEMLSLLNDEGLLRQIKRAQQEIERRLLAEMKTGSNVTRFTKPTGYTERDGGDIA